MGNARSDRATGNCYDNAAMESWNSTFKFECGEVFDSHAVAKDKVFDYIEAFYNPQPRRSAIGYMSPAGFERAASEKLAAWATRSPVLVRAQVQCQEMRS